MAGIHDIEDAAREIEIAFNNKQTGLSIASETAYLSGDGKTGKLIDADIERNAREARYTQALADGAITQEQFNAAMAASTGNYNQTIAAINGMGQAVEAAVQNAATLDTQVTQVERQAFATVEAAGYLASMNIYLREISENTSFLRPLGIGQSPALNAGGFNYGTGGTANGATVVINVSSSMLENPTQLGQAIVAGIDTALSKKANISNGAVGTVRVM